MTNKKEVLESLVEAQNNISQLVNLYSQDDTQPINGTNPEQPIKRKEWYLSRTLWMSLIASGVGILLLKFNFSIDSILTVISPILLWIGKEWHNDIKRV